MRKIFLLSLILLFSSSLTLRLLEKPTSSKDRIWMGWVKYESGKDGAKAIFGHNGYAYGKYNFDLRTNLVPFMDFTISQNNTLYSSFYNYAILGKGNEQLKNNEMLGKLWVNYYNKFPFHFEKMQDVKAYNDFYVAIKKLLKKNYNIDLDNHSPAVKGTAFSIAVKSGPEEGAKKFKGLNDKSSDKDIIDVVYASYGNEDNKRWTKEQQWGEALKSLETGFSSNVPITMKDNVDVEPDWAHQTVQELEDFIESQGVYIRQ